jgi:hypothetical protein
MPKGRYTPRKGEPVGASFALAQQKVAEQFLAAGDQPTGPKPLVEYANDPVGFFIDVLGVRPWKGKKVPGQMEFLEGLKTNSHNLLFAGTGPGKTFMLAGVVLWFMSTRRNAIVVTVATTWDQVVNQLWRQIRKMHKEALRPLPGKVLSHSWEIAEKWFAIGLSPRNPETLAGYHADIEVRDEVKKARARWRDMTNEEYFSMGEDPDGTKRNLGGAVMLIIDEASGVDDALHDAGEGILTGPGCYAIVSGNLTRTEGRFYKHWQNNPTPDGNQLCFDGEVPPPIGKRAPITLLSSAPSNTEVEHFEDPLLPPPDEDEPKEVTPEVPDDAVIRKPRTIDEIAAIKSEQALRRMEQTSKWKAYRWTAFDAPDAVIDRKFIMRLRRDCGREYWKNPRYMVRVLGMPPTGSSLSIYPLALLEESKDLNPRVGGRHVGIDLGFGGGDPSVAVLTVGGRVASIYTWNVTGAILDPYDTARVIFKLCTGCSTPLEATDPHRANKGWNVSPRNVHIDATGAGRSVPETLRRLWRFYVDPVVLSEKVQNDWRGTLGLPPYKLLNRRQELHWVMLRLMQEGMLAIPDRPEYGPIWADMTAVQFASDGLDEFRVELKKAFVKREGRSPDYSDALLLACSRSDPARVRFRTAPRRKRLR